MNQIKYLVKDYLEYAASLNLSKGALTHKRSALKIFTDWLDKRKMNHVNQLTDKVIENYAIYVYQRKKPDGNKLKPATHFNLISQLKIFIAWLVKHNKILYDVSRDVALPKVPKSIPKPVLTLAEVFKVLNMPDIETPFGLRDRAMLEILYSTGIRAKELSSLTLYDIDFKRGVLTVRQGKWSKDRVIPIGERAIYWTRTYIDNVRYKFINRSTGSILFLSNRGKAPCTPMISKIASDYIKKARIKKTGGSHLFRHTMATHMLENGADIRYIQEILGHVSVATTEVYTRVSVKKLQKVYEYSKPEV